MRQTEQAPFDYLAHYEKDAEVFDYFEERHGATAHSERRLREHILAQIPNGVASVLDVGCGSAWLAQHFQSSKVNVVSLDVSVVNTSRALERYPFAGHSAVAADTYELPFTDNAFDCIVAAEIIEHLHDPLRFVRELTRVVKPQGTIVISTPYKEKLTYEVCIHCNHLTPHNAHLHSFDEHKLEALFDKSLIASFDWSAFNNKLLLYGRTYPVLQHFPFKVWSAVDRMANSAIRKPVNIVVKACKR